MTAEYAFPSVPLLGPHQGMSDMISALASLYGDTVAGVSRLLGEQHQKNLRRTIDLFANPRTSSADVARILRLTSRQARGLVLTGAAPAATAGLPTADVQPWRHRLIHPVEHPVCALPHDVRDRPTLLWRCALLPLCTQHRVALSTTCHNCDRLPGSAVTLTTAASCADGHVPQPSPHHVTADQLQAQLRLQEIITAAADEKNVDDYQSVASLAQLILATDRPALTADKMPTPTWVAGMLPSLATVLDSVEAASLDDVVKEAAHASNSGQRQLLVTARAREAVTRARGRRAAVIGRLAPGRLAGTRLSFWTGRMHLVPSDIYRLHAAEVCNAAWQAGNVGTIPHVEGRRAMAQAIALHEVQGTPLEQIASLAHSGYVVRRPLQYVLEGLQARAVSEQWTEALLTTARATAGHRYPFSERRLDAFLATLRRIDCHRVVPADVAALWFVEEKLCCLGSRLKWPAPRLRIAAATLAVLSVQLGPEQELLERAAALSWDAGGAP